MADLDLKYSSDPTQDIVDRVITCYFGQRAITETVAVNKINSTGMFSNVNIGTQLGIKEIDGISTCLGTTFSYTLLSQQVTQLDPLNFSYARGARSTTTYIPGEINIKVSWDTYMPQQSSEQTSIVEQPSGNATPDIAPIDKIVIIKNGFSVKCVNIKDSETFGNGIIRSNSDYINNLIPDIDHAIRVGENLIYNSMKNLNIEINTIPHFSIKLRQYIQVPVSYLFYSEILKVEGIEFSASSGADQSFIIHTRGRRY